MKEIGWEEGNDDDDDDDNNDYGDKHTKIQTITATTTIYSQALFQGLCICLLGREEKGK